MMKPKEIFAKLKFENRNNLTEAEAREVLIHYGIPVAKAEMIRSYEDASKAGERVGYPLVLKAISPQIIHKTEAGAVILNVRNDKELKLAYSQLLRNVKTKRPDASLDGILVQQMLTGGYEVIVGGKYDQTFGQVLLFGFGGIFVEVYDDVSFRIVPISKEDAREMMEEIKAVKILKGYRGRKPANMDALVDVLLKTSKMLQENPEIKELDINPVFATSQNAVATDARIIIE